MTPKQGYIIIMKYISKRCLKKLIKKGHLVAGCFHDIYVEHTVTFGKNITLYPFVVLSGNTYIGDESSISSFSNLDNCQIGKKCTIVNSIINNSKIGDNTSVGPFAYLRQNTVVENECRIGDFVELKNSHINDKTKIAHLAYVGDATIGKKVNIGCGVVFVNYDGKTKQQTTIEDNAFIGSNVNLVAPITIGKGCYIACGSTVTKSLKKNDFAIGRSQLYIKENGAIKYFSKGE